MAKRPRDPNQLAKVIVDISTGEAEDAISKSKRDPKSLKGRPGGLKGGQSRSKSLAASRRSEIARKAAKTRWAR